MSTLDADVGHQLRVSLYECFAERPEVASGKPVDSLIVMGCSCSRRLDPSTARRGEHQEGKEGGERTGSEAYHQNQRLLCATRACRCQGIGPVSQLVTIDLRSRPVKISSIHYSADCFSGGSMRIWWRALLLAVFVSVAVNVCAQALYGSLLGNVTDETGAALPGATVSVTQRETNLVRDVVTNETGGFNVPNLLPGTYQIDVKLQGFSTYTARDISVRQGLDVRVDAKLKVGALEESIIVSGQAAVLQTESAAVQSLTTASQLETVPTSGRAYQTALALMPGVAQPNYDQSGGSNNPTRSMAITVNGQPPNNTVVRLDGVSQINQFFQQIQAYSPSLEAIETVSVVTSSFDADQGMAGGASVNVQVKSGTNTLAGSLFEHATDYRMKAKNFFLRPAIRRAPAARMSMAERSAGPFNATSCSSLPASSARASARKPATPFRTRARTASAAFRRWRCARGTSRAPARCSTTRGQAQRPARDECPSRSELSGSQRDHRSAVRGVQLHPGQPHQPDREELPERAGSADAAGIREQLLRDQQLRQRLQQVRRQDHLDAQRARHRQRPAGYADSYEDSAPEMPRSTAASTRSSRDVSGIRRFTAIHWRSPPRCRRRW